MPRYVTELSSKDNVPSNSTEDIRSTEDLHQELISKVDSNSKLF